MSTTVWVNGCFDLLHAGHIDFLRRASYLGNSLAVWINSDASIHKLKGDGRPVIREADRRDCLLSLSCVSQVWVFSEENPVAAWTRNSTSNILYVQTARPGVLESEEVAWCFRTRIPVVLLGRSHPESTTAIIDRIRNAPSTLP